jgi:apolipoprotein N-acyltransferase
MKTKFNLRLAGLWFLTLLAFILLSPKWLFAPAGWLAPASMLWFVHQFRFWKGALLGWSALFISGLIGGYGVLPFPGVFFVIMTIFISVVKVIPYIFSNWLVSRFPGSWITIFVFPSVLVVTEYLDSFGGGGTWGSLAYTQFEQTHLIQLASLLGIWSITFLIGWFSSLLVWVSQKQFTWTQIKGQTMFFAGTLTCALVFGHLKTNPYLSNSNHVVRMAGITANNAELVKAMYEDYFDRRINIDPDQLSQSSPELMELQKGFVKFIENPEDKNFNSIHYKIGAYQDSLLMLAEREAKGGARIISFSEGLFLATKKREGELVAKAQQLAEQNSVYVALAVATLLKGQVQAGSKYIENKILFINPQGKIETTFFKNKPVPIVEGSVPGDGEIPVVQTPFGRIGLSICYDADFPALMRKASAKGADIMILPSGDWREVSPYHAQMAVFRAIENGFSLFRMVSGATSIAADFNGRILSSTDFYNKGERVMTTYIPTRGGTTVYSVVGDVLPIICSVVVIAMCSAAFIKKSGLFSHKVTPLHNISES